MLSAVEQGIVIVGHLDVLPAADDILTGKITYGCCPVCCAPCQVLAQLYDTHRLNPLVRLAPQHLWRDAVWWKNDAVDPSHLMTAWYWNGCPDHV